MLVFFFFRWVGRLRLVSSEIQVMTKYKRNPCTFFSYFEWNFDSLSSQYSPPNETKTRKKVGVRKKYSTVPHPGTRAVPLGRDPVSCRRTITGVGRPKSQGINPRSQQLSQPSDHYNFFHVTIHNSNNNNTYAAYLNLIALMQQKHNKSQWKES